MLIFLSLLILYLLFFVYNKIDVQTINQFMFFFKYELSNLERTNLLILFINILFLIGLTIYLIISITHKKTNKKISKTRKTTRKSKTSKSINVEL